jgi:hypothetical protein
MSNLKKQAFAYDVSTIGGYSDQVGGELLAKALIGGTTASIVNVRTGIKGTQALNLLDSTPVFQAGNCSLSPSGLTQFTQHSITTCPETLFESLCYKQLFATYQSMLMKAGQTQEEVPFEQMILDLKKKQIEQHVEINLWKSVTGSSANLFGNVTGQCFTGFATLISSGSTFASGVANSSGTTFSSSAAYGISGNPITEVDNLINVLDSNALVREDLVVFMSYSNFRLYVQALTRANFFTNYIDKTDVTSNMKAIHPNTNIQVVPTLGLNGSNQVVIGPAEYMIYGVDLLSDETLRAWYSLDFDEIRIRSNFNYGATIATFGTTKYFAYNGLGLTA